MTETQFLTRLANKVKRTKAVADVITGGMIVLDGAHCPISFVAGGRVCQTTNDRTDRPLLGLSQRSWRRIVSSADNTNCSIPALRRKLLKACGL